MRASPDWPVPQPPTSAPKSTHPSQSAHCSISSERRKISESMQRSKRRVPYPMDRPIPHVRIERPGSRRPGCNAAAEGSVGDQENWNGGEGGEQAIDGKQNPCRGVSINAENFEDGRNQVRVKRRLPCARARVSSVGIAEPLSQGDRAAYAAHLKTKAEVILSRPHSILVKCCDRCHLQNQREQHHPPNRSGNGRKVRSLHHGRVYQAL